MKKKMKRSYLVNYRYQLRQAGIILASHLLVALLMTGLLSWVYLFMMNSSIVYDHNRQLPWYLAGTALLITFATTWWVIRHSHRVAGTMVKIDQTLSQAAKGNFPDDEISFRQKDHFPQMASALNNCLSDLQTYHKHRNIILTILPEVKDKLHSGQLTSQEAAKVIQTTIDGFALPS